MHVSNWRAFARAHWLLLLFLLLIPLLLVLLSPSLQTGFINDDFNDIAIRHYDALDSLPRQDYAFWTQLFVKRALTDLATGLPIIRPTRQLTFWSDYFMFHLNAFGYRFSEYLFYLVTCLLVALIEYRLTFRRAAAFLAGLFFAVLPVHSAPVVAISSRGHLLAATFIALSLLFYILPRTRLRVVVSLIAYAFAIGSQETALIFPALLILYEAIYHREDFSRAPRQLLWRLLPYGLMALAVVLLRQLLFGRLSYVEGGAGDFQWLFQLEGYSLVLLQPFIDDISDAQTIAFIAFLGLLLAFYHSRREVWFGFLWVPLSLIIALVSSPQERYFFTPSIGLALAFGSILAQPFPFTKPWTRAASALLAAVVLVALTFGAYVRNREYANIGAITASIFTQLKTLHPTLPPSSNLVFVGLPLPVKRGAVMPANSHLQFALQLAYADRSLHAAAVKQFPLTVAAPDRTFFLEYSKPKLTERADLTTALRERVRCGDSPARTIVWDFGSGAQGWEAWNDIDVFESGAGGLSIRSSGSDPFMGSPPIEVKPSDLDRVEIKLSARSNQPLLNAELYWQTSAMDDFTADAKQSFQVPADGATRTIDFKLPVRGSDPIVRLRLDPADAPADLTINSITLVCQK